MKQGSLYLLGGGGHARAVIDLIATEGRWHVAGILDQPSQVGTDVLGVPVTGTDDLIPQLAAKGHAFLISVGHLGDPGTRVRLFDAVHAASGTLATVVSPHSHVALAATIGPGSTVGHYALVNSGVTIGSNTILNSGTLVEHDSVIGDHCHLSPGVVINGGAHVGHRTFIGSGAIVAQGIRIGQGCVVGAGSLVLHNVPDGTTVYGSPARPGT